MLQFNAGTSTTLTLVQSVYTDPATGDVIHWGRWRAPTGTAGYNWVIDGTTVAATSSFHYM